MDDTTLQLPSIPPELLVKIAELLPPVDLNNFRLTNRAYACAGGSVLLHPDKLSRMYIHPSSVHRSIEVCDDETFASKLESVVLLAGAHNTPSHYNRTTPNLDDHPWPHFLTTTPGANESLVDLVRSENTPFDIAYAGLTTGFGKLKNVQTIIYTTETDRAGLNKPSRAEINECILANADHSGKFGLAGQPSLLFAKRMVRWSNVAVMTGLVLHGPSGIGVVVSRKSTDMLTRDLYDHRLVPSIINSRALLHEHRPGATFLMLQEKLRSLSYCLGHGMLHSLAKALLTACPNIQSVTVHLASDGRLLNDNPVDAYAVSQCLWACKELHSLRNFAIINESHTPSPLDIRRDLVGPVTSGYDHTTLRFLLQHGPTLVSLRLENIVLTKPRGDDVQSGMLEGLKVIKTHPLHQPQRSIIASAEDDMLHQLSRLCGNCYRRSLLPIWLC
ncbi:hypothetical protein LTR36_000547 [Oleoguttula mirabilis]|uniref:F-box domain-containing protein n=1 Tax=Oleoguttula mirabilis TaxID=1507867 RepID=A0AAV9JRE1_9PEZI|nr:hypothetical protein LTR36_000547 [Oleoguttula mirabilis]